jgi:hypothetical protein
MMPNLFAYLDLGAGSMLLQMILAGILGLSFTIKTYWRRIARVIRREKEDGSTMSEPPPADDRP